MSETPNGEELFIKEGSPLPENGSFKYVHVPEGVHFGIDHPEALVLGSTKKEHTDIAMDYFSSIGAEPSIKGVQEIGFINAGLLKANPNGLILMGKSGGLKAETSTHKRADMTMLTKEEKTALDEKTVNYLKVIYPDKNFRAV